MKFFQKSLKRNEEVHLVWAQFAEHYAYVRNQADNSEKLNKKLAEIIALLTCEEQSNSRKSIKFNVTLKSKDILSRMNRRVEHLLQSSSKCHTNCLHWSWRHCTSSKVDMVEKIYKQDAKMHVCDEKDGFPSQKLCYYFIAKLLYFFEKFTFKRLQMQHIITSKSSSPPLFCAPSNRDS
ncbi:small RNA degrading nuclease 5 isoform X3 [Capsicum annuum]|uniref:small RNA degrading nuclease 5 isoform X3 n=1 Tax=Capsicum annuum TaxID=4072 RepID=UPI001FB0C17E|nr:small RNA degrading nuclease 5 isoform X3 [Capsicum annuum]XP_047256399.1 small RNA degrading nuclease 5 isoform X3 [Capsicum annuum]XP_047256400.1 small RNA degrading nuclease 5 isoform X3 [Capsicum annuum]